MEDWEDVQIPPLLSKEQPRNKWDDEYVDEDDVKESWEDEDEPAPESYHYIGLLKAIMRLSMTAMKAADANEVSASVSAIANEKIKAEKEANAGKKKPMLAKRSKLGRENSFVDKPEDDLVVNPL